MPVWYTPSSSSYSFQRIAPATVKKKKDDPAWWDFFGVPKNFAGDIKDFAIGTALAVPRALGVGAHDAKKLFTGDWSDFKSDDAAIGIAKGVYEDYKYTYGDLFSDPSLTLKKIKRHPLGPVLDVMALASLGGSAVGKAAQSSVKRTGSESAAKRAGLEKRGTVSPDLSGVNPAMVPRRDVRGLGQIEADSDLFDGDGFNRDVYATKYLGDIGASNEAILTDIMERVGRRGIDGQKGITRKLDDGSYEVFTPRERRVGPKDPESDKGEVIGGYIRQASPSPYRRGMQNIVDKASAHMHNAPVIGASRRGARQAHRVGDNSSLVKGQVISARLKRDADRLKAEHPILYRAFPYLFPSSTLRAKNEARAAQIEMMESIHHDTVARTKSFSEGDVATLGTKKSGAPRAGIYEARAHVGRDKDIDLDEPDIENAHPDEWKAMARTYRTRAERRRAALEKKNPDGSEKARAARLRERIAEDERKAAFLERSAGVGEFAPSSIRNEHAYLNSPDFEAVRLAMMTDKTEADKTRLNQIIEEYEATDPTEGARMRETLLNPKVIEKYRAFMRDSVRAYYQNIAPDMMKAHDTQAVIAGKPTGKGENIQRERSIAEEKQLREIGMVAGDSADSKGGPTPVDLDTVESYSAYGFRDIQDSLREAVGDPGSIPDPDIVEFIHDLDSAFDRAPRTTRDLMVYRGIDLDDLEALDAAGMLADFGYTSTSINKKVAERFATRRWDSDGEVIIVRIPKGTPHINVDEYKQIQGGEIPVTSENEILLPRGGRLELSGISNDGNHYIVDFHLDLNPLDTTKAGKTNLLDDATDADVDLAGMEAEIMGKLNDMGIDVEAIRAEENATNLGVPVLSHTVFRESVDTGKNRQGRPGEQPSPSSPEFKKSNFLSNEFALAQLNGPKALIRTIEHAALASESTSRFRGMISQMYAGDKAPAAKGWVLLDEKQKQKLRGGIEDIASFFNDDFDLISGGTRVDMIDQMTDTLANMVEDLAAAQKIWVPEGAMKTLFPMVAREANMAGAIWQNATRFWRNLTLGIRPTWMINNMIGNVTLLAMEHGLWRSIGALYHTYRDSMAQSRRMRRGEEIDPENPLTADVVEQHAPMVVESSLYRDAGADTSVQRKAKIDEGIARGDAFDDGFMKWLAGQDPDSAVGETISKMDLIKNAMDNRATNNAVTRKAMDVGSGHAGLRFNARWVDDPARRAAFMLNLAPHIKKLRKKTDMSKAEAIAHLMNDPEIRDWSIQKTMRDMIDYRDMTPNERKWLRGTFPFYAWLRGMTRRFAQLAIDKPAKMAMINNVAGYHVATADFDDRYPEWMRRLAKIDPGFMASLIQGDEEGTPVVDFGPANIFQTPADIISLIESLTYGDKEDMKAGGSVLNYSNPYLKAALEMMTGTNLYTGNQLAQRVTDPQMSNARILAEQTISAFPILRDFLVESRGQDPEYTPMIVDGSAGRIRVNPIDLGHAISNRVVNEQAAMESEARRVERKQREIERALEILARKQNG